VFECPDLTTVSLQPTERTQIVLNPICYRSFYVRTENRQFSLFVMVSHLNLNRAHLVGRHVQSFYIRQQPVIEPLRFQKRSLQQSNLPLGEILELQLVDKHSLGFPALFRLPKSVFNPFRLAHEYGVHFYIIPHRVEHTRPCAVCSTRR